MTTTYIPGAPCPCGCSATGSKLSFKTGHVARTCLCRPCIGTRNQRKGKRGQAKAHRALGGTGFTPSNEESGRPYLLLVLPEVKAGAQIPASWDRFTETEWFRRALSQSSRAVPFGSGALPAVVIRGDWLVADLRGRT
jgi:hypothetical protein